MLLNPYRFFIPITACDPYWNNVTSLMHFNGVDGATAVVDEKGLAWTVEGDATLSATQGKFGTSLKTSYAGEGRIKQLIPTYAGSVWDLGTTYTIEAHVFPLSLGTDAVIITTDAVTQGGFAGLRLDISASGAVRAVLTPTTGGELLVLSSAVNIATGAFSHIALSVDNGTARIFINGVVQASSSAGVWPRLSDSAIAFAGVGGYTNGTVPSYSFNGYIDEVRVTKGVARYTSSFTPETEEFAGTAC